MPGADSAPMRHAQVAIQPLPRPPPAASGAQHSQCLYTVDSLAGYFVPCPEDSATAGPTGRPQQPVQPQQQQQQQHADPLDAISTSRTPTAKTPLTSVRETRVLAQDCILRSAQRIRNSTKRRPGNPSSKGSRRRRRRLDGDGDYVQPADRDQPSCGSSDEHSEHGDDNSGENLQLASGLFDNSSEGDDDDNAEIDDHGDGDGGDDGSDGSEGSDMSDASNGSGCSLGRRRPQGRWGGRAAVRVGAPGTRCFLCDYCTSLEVRFVTTFISDNIANMDVGLMAEQIRKYVFDKRPEYSKGNHGLEVATIKNHIRQHMLSPTVRIADMMRHLLKLCDSMRSGLERVDPDTGESSADKSNIDTYLRVVTKVLDMYKMSETNKMLFASTEK